jgi:membrane-associated phospholipid phosphatase
MNPENSLPRRNLARRLIVTALVLGVWFWTQSLIGARSLPATGIGDAIHQWTAPLNSYFYENLRAANALLIVSSALIDALGLFLLGSWLVGRTVRPFFGLVLLLSLRQIMQIICALPAPTHMVWHHPGFPSLLVTYGVANDYFFSGHTAIAVFAATQLARFERRWLTVLGIGVVLFEIATVLVLRAHYTMDVFTGIVTALWIAVVSDRIAPPVDRFLLAQK